MSMLGYHVLLALAGGPLHGYAVSRRYYALTSAVSRLLGFLLQLFPSAFRTRFGAGARGALETFVQNSPAERGRRHRAVAE